MAGFGKIKGGISLPATTALNSAVYGIYTAAEAEAYRKLGKWPTAPVAPGAPTAVTSIIGNAQVLLTWSAPADNGGASITDYAIQYSSNSGTTWTAFSDSTSTDTAATVTGLTNDTAYIFRVAAVNVVGAGSYSAASSAVTPSATSVSVAYLLVAGGGGGGGCVSGNDGGGGGGAGGLLSGEFILTPQDTLSVVVGTGGPCNTNGQNSVLGSFTAIGGGTGGFNNPKTNGANGGSGGGVGRDGCTLPGSGTVGQGNNGGNTDCSGYRSAGGGGGAGEAGYDGGFDADPPSGSTSKGGNGLPSSITGTLTYYAGGGGGGRATYNASNSTSQGGLGGGGAGGGGQPADGQNGEANTGGGGGGGRNGTGGTGGSGVAIVAYPATYPELAVAPSLTYTQPTRLGYRVYRFTAGSGLIAFPNQTAAPSAPTNLAFVPGNEQVSLSWTGAFSAGPSVSDYVIQYSSDNGSSWTTFSDSTSTNTSAIVTGLTNGTTYKFRVAAVNSIGTGDYSATITGTPSTALVITAQPKNDYATASNVNITFSVTTSGGGTPTYQWQYFGADEYNGDYEYRWRDITGATASSYVTNGSTLGNLMSYEFSYTGTAKLRCVVTAEGGASTLTSDIVRFVELDYLHYPNNNWYGTQGTYPNYVHYTQPYTFSPQVGELPVLDFYDYAMGYPDTSWYTGNDTTFKLQVATNGYTDSADWTDLFTQDYRGSISLYGYTLTPSTGTKYYRAILVDKWPYAVNNGTQSTPARTPPHVYPYSNSSILQVTWPAPPPLLSMTRSNNGGTITGWSGEGTAASPFTRSAGYVLNEFDGLTHYSWTAGAAATVTFVFDYSDDTDNGENYQLMRMSGGPPYAAQTGTSGGAITKTVSVIAGDVLFFSSTGDPSSQYFANVSVSATAT